jgi:addiction module HigA family antidote
MKKQTVLVPGSVLKETFLEKYQISVSKVSEDIGLSPSAVRQIINNKLKISTVVALRLSKYFDTPAKYWIDLQNSYDLAELEKDSALTDALKKIPKAKKAPPAKKPAAKAAAKAGGTKTAAKGAASKVAAAKAGAGKKAAPKAAKLAAGKKAAPKTVKAANPAKKAVVKAPRKPRTPKAPAGNSPF